MEFEYIETDRLKLRKITPDVMEYVYGILTDDELMAFFGITSPEVLEKEVAVFYLGDFIKKPHFHYCKIYECHYQIDNAENPYDFISFLE